MSRSASALGNGRRSVGEQSAGAASSFPRQAVDHPQVADCTVPYDGQSGCGVNVSLAGQRLSTFVAITFVTAAGPSEPHDLTLPQAQQLRAALDAVTRSERVDETGHRPGEPVYRVAGT